MYTVHIDPPVERIVTIKIPLSAALCLLHLLDLVHAYPASYTAETSQSMGHLRNAMFTSGIRR